MRLQPAGGTAPHLKSLVTLHGLLDCAQADSMNQPSSQQHSVYNRCQTTKNEADLQPKPVVRHLPPLIAWLQEATKHEV